jgi:hypothetical protein
MANSKNAQHRLPITSFARKAFALSASVLATSTFALEPVREIGAYVQPYYISASKPGDQPTVHVGTSYDALLASNDPADIRKARDLIEAAPDLVTPMTIMVLAIRLYDVGMRDDSVFWFYVAKDRYLTLVGVVDEGAIGSAKDAVPAFASLAGPFINSYAFCDVERQVATTEKAWKWVAAHPYQAIYMPQLQAKPGGRDANLLKAVEGLQQSAEQARVQLANPDFLKKFRAKRVANGVNDQFCWK